jgi:hypothetical protein
MLTLLLLTLAANAQEATEEIILLEAAPVQAPILVECLPPPGYGVPFYERMADEVLAAMSFFGAVLIGWRRIRQYLDDLDGGGGASVEIAERLADYQNQLASSKSTLEEERGRYLLLLNDRSDLERKLALLEADGRRDQQGPGPGPAEDVERVRSIGRDLITGG